jgi:hypothetical protein
VRGEAKGGRSGCVHHLFLCLEILLACVLAARKDGRRRCKSLSLHLKADIVSGYFYLLSRASTEVSLENICLSNAAAKNVSRDNSSFFYFLLILTLSAAAKKTKAELELNLFDDKIENGKNAPHSVFFSLNCLQRPPQMEYVRRFYTPSFFL